jgi:hypothetical protein
VKLQGSTPEIFVTECIEAEGLAPFSQGVPVVRKGGPVEEVEVQKVARR